MLNPMVLMRILSSNNPMQALTQQYGNNPDFQRAVQMAQGKSGAEVQEIIANLAKQRGLDPKVIMDNLNKFGIRL